ncbi:MAG: hypothetical protein QOD11_375 [Bradyrhizobium sp.]|jgi:hypothetical protein|nr:hypothetical protein [Bradyrhizobium sp.]
MPLLRGRILGYDAGRMTFEFTMMHEARIVDCEISSAAMDDLAGGKGVRPGERETQFRRLRDAIERVASDIFDPNDMSAGRTIRIFSKHVRNR